MKETDPTWTDQRDFWATRSAFPEPNPDEAAGDPEHRPDREGPEKPRKTVVRREHSHVSCLLIGPAGSGKSSFVAAIEQASLMEREGTTASKLTASLGAGPTPRSPQRSTPATYRFEVTLHRAASSGTTCELRIREQPGNLFRLREHGAPAGVAWPGSTSDRPRRCLALVVDPFNAVAARWRGVLPTLLRRLSSTARPDAVLVAISKADVLSAQIQRSPTLAGVTGFHPRARDIALRIDPWQQALEFLGQASLELLRTSVPTPNDLACGVVSAVGFDRESGQAVASPPRGAVQPGWATAPFGIQDALRFLVLGEVAGRWASPPTPRQAPAHWHRITP